MNALFWSWVEQEATCIKSDGCTLVPDFYKKCCLIHDVAYWYGKSPSSAYTYWKNGLSRAEAWKKADNINQKAADLLLRNCIQENSWFGRWSPMAWWRFYTLRKLGGKAWRSHEATHDV